MHLLLALLEQEDGFAPAALRKLSADVVAISERTRAAIAELPTVAGERRAAPRPSCADERAAPRRAEMSRTR